MLPRERIRLLSRVGGGLGEGEGEEKAPAPTLGSVWDVERRRPGILCECGWMLG